MNTLIGSFGFASMSMNSDYLIQISTCLSCSSDEGGSWISIFCWDGVNKAIFLFGFAKRLDKVTKKNIFTMIAFYWIALSMIDLGKVGFTAIPDL